MAPAYDLAIIGGGVSGLTLAHFAAASGRSVCIIEASNRIGGSFASKTFPELGGFWVELGCHTIYNSYATLIDIMHHRGIEPRMMKRGKGAYLMYRDGVPKKLTDGFSWSEVMLNGWKLFFANKAGKTARAYYSSVFGKTNYEKMFKNVLGAVISQDPDDFPADILLKKRPRAKDMPRSFTFDHGLSVFTDSLAAIENVTVMIDAPATAVERAGEGWQISVNGSKIDAGKLALAVQPSVAARLLEPVAPNVAAPLSNIPSVEIESMGIAVPRDDVSIDPFAFLIADASAPFSSVVSRDVVPDGDYRGFTFHFRPGRLDRAEKLSVTAHVLGIDAEKLTHVAEYTHTAPKLAPDHYDTVDAIESALRSEDGLYLTGNYFGGLAIEDCLVRSAYAASRIFADEGEMNV